LLNGSILLLTSRERVGLGFTGNGESGWLDFVDGHVISPTSMSV
jgi:hypothetical protein